MPITNADCGVWTLDEVYLKINANRWVCYNVTNDPGQLWAWGFNNQGQLGTNDTVTRSSPVQIPGNSWFQVDGGGGTSYTVLARKCDNTLWSWGSNYRGELGQNDRVTRSSPVQIPGTTWMNVSVGAGATAPKQSTVLAIKSEDRDYAFWSWGYNGFGQFGTNDRVSRSSPVQVIGTCWTQVSAGYLATGAIRSDNTLWIWGDNTCGPLGQNDRVCRSSPVQIPGTTWTQVSVGSGTTAARKSDGTLWSWGYNGRGALGTNDRVNRSSPVQVPGNAWTEIATNGFTSIARKSDGTLWVWGGNQGGTLGTNDIVFRSSPVQIPGTSWTRAGLMNGSSPSSALNAFAIKSDNTLWVWGCNTIGQLGQNDTVSRSSPVQVPGTNWADASVAAGGFSPPGQGTLLARKSDGTLWSWGYNGRGSLGTNDTVSRSSPVQVPGTNWTEARLGFAGFSANFAVARKSDGTLWSWGDNGAGQLGQNDTVSRSSPIQVPGTDWTCVTASGQGSTVALKNNGLTLWSWGRNNFGQLGVNNTVDRASPIQVGAAWTDITAFGMNGAARKSDGTLWVWGLNSVGELGTNNMVARSSPVQVPGTTWVEVAGGEAHLLARKSDGTLWSWGYNNRGRLGDNTIINRSSPIQIPGTSWTQVSAGCAHSLARKSDGTLWTWGYNFGPYGGFGKLGDGTIINRSSPTQIPGTAWVDVAASLQQTVARKSDGTLWAWGLNNEGQLGTNDTVTRSSPVQVPGTGWIRSGKGSLAIKSNN